MPPMRRTKSKKPTDLPDLTKVTPRHFSRFLKGTFHYYSAILTGRFSWLLNLVFRLLFARVALSDSDHHELRRVAEQGAICYVIRSRSRLEYLLLSFKLRREELPFPVFCHYLSVYLWQSWLTTLRRVVAVIVSVFERKGYPNPYRNGFVRQLIVDRVPTLLPLHHFRGLPLRFSRQRLDPLQELIQIRRDTNRPIMIVPLVIVYGRKPVRETKSILDMIVGPADNPGRIRRVIMFLRNLGNITIKVGEAQELEDLEAVASMRVPMMADRLPETAYHIRQACLERIEAERRVVLGPARKSRAELIEQVLHERGFLSALLDYCKQNDEPFIPTRRRARRYLEEMAADYKVGTISFLRWVMDRALPRVYDSVEVDMDGLEKVRRISRRMPVVYMPSHKSHIDYILLNYVLYNNHVSLPFTISGVNLNFWPIGKIFRNSGAFYIRRSFRGKRIYSLCFSKYLEAVLREGIGMTFYVEGGRSRIGKLLPPKTGFLQYLLEAAVHSGRREIAFVPVSIGYERIFEEQFYTKEAAGRPNEGETLSTMLKHRRLLSKKRGRVWLDFADPIPMREMLWEDKLTSIPRKPDERRAVAEKIAYRAVNAINDRQPVTPYAMVAEALLAGTRRGVPADVIVQRFELLEDMLAKCGAPMPARGANARATVRVALATMVAEKLLGLEEGEAEDEPPFYFLEQDNRLPLTIYANTVVPHHLFSGLLALALSGDKTTLHADELFDQFRFLVRLLSREFVYGKRKRRTESDDRVAFDQAVALFEGYGWLQIDGQEVGLSDEGRFAAETLSAVVKGYVESYHLAARALLLYKAEQFTEKEFLKGAIKKGTRLVSVGELDHPEAVHKNLLETALRHYADEGLLRAEMQIGDKTKTATRQYQVADFVRLRSIAERTRIYLPQPSA